MSGTDPIVIAIDAGTGSARALAFSLDGQIVAQAVREWVHHPVSGHPGGIDFNTETAWQLISECLREVCAAVPGQEIVAVSSSSMREGFVLYDGGGREIFACPNTDGRGRNQAEELVTDGTAERIYATGGDWVSLTAPNRLLWLNEHRPDILDRTRHMGMISDWVIYKLSGEFTTDPTCGSSTALFDLRCRTWAYDLAERCHLSREVLPPVVEPGTAIGTISPEVAAETGLPSATPVVVGGADTQLALYGLGSVSGTPTVVAGTFWQTTTLGSSPIVDPQRRVRTLCHVTPDQWMIEGIGFLSGLALRWYRDAFCPDAIEKAEERGVSAFQVMEEWASTVPAGSYGVMALLANVMQADAWHHTAPSFVQYDINDPEHSNRAASIHAIAEASAYVAKGHLDILHEITGGQSDRNRRLLVTGGASTGRLWPQTIASVTGLTTDLSVFSEATAYGTARLAGKGVGADLQPAGEISRTVSPAPDDYERYQSLYRQWVDTYDAHVIAGARSGLQPLFTPPGGLDYQPRNESEATS